MSGRGPAGLSLAEVLDGAAEAVSSVAAPWLGVLWLCALPLRLLQAHFLARLLQLGAEAPLHGTYLTGLAAAMTAALLPWLWGRAVFVRACGFGLRRQVPGAAALRVGTVPFAGYLFTGLLTEVAFWATAWTLVMAPAFVAVGALAAATCPLVERAGPLEPLRQIARHGRHGLLLVGLLAVLGVGFMVALLNLHFVFQAGVWLAGAVPGLDPLRWQRLLALGENPRYLLALAAGATLAVEPYLLAAATVYVHKVRSRQSGEDLRLWLERLRRRDEAA